MAKSAKKSHVSKAPAKGGVQIGRAIRGLLRIRAKGTRYMTLPRLVVTVKKLVASPQAL